MQGALRPREYNRLLVACAAQHGGSFTPIHRASLPSAVRFLPASTKGRFHLARDVEVRAHLCPARRESHATGYVRARGVSASETAL